MKLIPCLSAAVLCTASLFAADFPVTVYAENGENAPWIPSGYMGETSAIAMDGGCTEKPFAGNTCLKVQYNKADGWAGVFWQDPANDWGDRAGGKNLTGATKLTFQARGKNGGEKVKFGFGGIANKPFSDTAKGEMELTLTNQWQRYSLPLEGKDLSRIKSGFMWVLGGQGSPVEFYLDDIRYEK